MLSRRLSHARKPYIALYDSVRGCDGKTCGNTCEAAAAGTGVNTCGPNRDELNP